MLNTLHNVYVKRAYRLIPLALLLLSSATMGMDEKRLNKLKVAYIYNFTKFIEWKKAPTDQFNICLKTQNKALIGAFSEIEKKGPKITVLTADSNNEEHWETCQIIYLESPIMLSEKTIESLPNTLLVSEVKSESAQIYFILINNKLRFSISKNRAEQAGLSISSKLLRLAHEVY